MDGSPYKSALTAQHKNTAHPVTTLILEKISILWENNLKRLAHLVVNLSHAMMHHNKVR